MGKRKRPDDIKKFVVDDEGDFESDSSFNNEDRSDDDSSSESDDLVDTKSEGDDSGKAQKAREYDRGLIKPDCMVIDRPNEADDLHNDGTEKLHTGSKGASGHDQADQERNDRGRLRKRTPKNYFIPDPEYEVTDSEDLLPEKPAKRGRHSKRQNSDEDEQRDAEVMDFSDDINEVDEDLPPRYESVFPEQVLPAMPESPLRSRQDSPSPVRHNSRSTSPCVSITTPERSLLEGQRTTYQRKPAGMAMDRVATTGSSVDEAPSIASRSPVAGSFRTTTPARHALQNHDPQYQDGPNDEQQDCTELELAGELCSSIGMFDLASVSPMKEFVRQYRQLLRLELSGHSALAQKDALVQSTYRVKQWMVTQLRRHQHNPMIRASIAFTGVAGEHATLQELLSILKAERYHGEFRAIMQKGVKRNAV